MQLLINEITDRYIRENFQRLRGFLRGESILNGKFTFFQITFTGAVTNFKYPHNLGFSPKDVIQTSITGAGALTWNYAKFDKTNLDITTTGACVVRAFIGSYVEGSDA